MKITICACSSRTFIEKEKVGRLAAAIRKTGAEVELVADLCEMCEDHHPKATEVGQGVIVACHKRAVESLMRSVGVDECRTQNLRSQSVDEILQALQMTEKAADVTSEEMEPWMDQMARMPQKLGEDAWFPTLYKTECAECGKCLEFCPFGVYEMVDDRIKVVHPHHCKNNCPACARTCPAGAIIFPKYDRSPINGGEQKEEKAFKLDSKELFGQALREKLAARKTGIKLMR